MAKKSFVTFRLGQQKYGLEIDKVREINRYLELTPVPDALDYICGLINLRGQIITVFDLCVRLGMSSSEINDNTHNIILKTQNMDEQLDDSQSEGDIVGILVYDIEDVTEVEESEIEAPPANIGKVDGRFLTGILKTEKDLIALLSIDEILKQNR